MIETSVKCVIKDPLTSRYILVLETLCGHYLVPVYIGAFEAESIYCIINRIKSPRPMTFDFISGILGFIDEVNIDRVVIDRYEDGLYKASVFVNCNKVEKRIDCRPTDAVSLALQMDVPVYVEDDIISCKCVNRTTMNEMDNKTLGTLIDNDHGSIFWNV
ncbi:MAG: bifunctional nuclease family protein [Deferribacterales bacterium]